MTTQTLARHLKSYFTVGCGQSVATIRYEGIRTILTITQHGGADPGDFHEFHLVKYQRNSHTVNGVEVVDDMITLYIEGKLKNGCDCEPCLRENE